MGLGSDPPLCPELTWVGCSRQGGVSRSGVFRGARYPRGLPLGTGIAAFCHHLVETHGRDQAQPDQDAWEHSLSFTYSPYRGVPPGLGTHLAWLLGSHICFAAQLPASRGQCSEQGVPS